MRTSVSAVQRIVLSRENSNSPPYATHACPLPFQVFYAPHILPLLARRNRPPQRRLDVRPHEPVARLLRGRAAFAQIRDEAFCQPDRDVEALRFVACFESLGQVAGAGGDGDEVGGEREMLLCEGEGRGEVFFAIPLGQSWVLEGWLEGGVEVPGM